MIEISKAEEMVLLAIWRLGERAYGVSIRRQILKDTGKDYTYGTLYGLLRQMDNKGFLQKITAGPVPVKGGRSKSYFRLSPLGIRALKDAYALHKRLWREAGDFSPDRS